MGCHLTSSGAFLEDKSVEKFIEANSVILAVNDAETSMQFDFPGSSSFLNQRRGFFGRYRTPTIQTMAQSEPNKSFTRGQWRENPCAVGLAKNGGQKMEMLKGLQDWPS